MFTVYKFIDGHWYYHAKDNEQRANEIAAYMYEEYGIICKVVEE